MPPRLDNAARTHRPRGPSGAARGCEALFYPEDRRVFRIILAHYLLRVDGKQDARYERGAMILTSNRGFAEWGDLFGHPVVAAALLDRPLHHAIVIQIEGASYRLRQHVDLIP